MNSSWAATPGGQGQYNLAYLGLASFVAALGGLLFGWDWVVIGGAKPFFERYFQITGFRENVAALGHHRISLLGPACGICGKPSRTPRARFCGACGSPRR